MIMIIEEELIIKNVYDSIPLRVILFVTGYYRIRFM